MSLIKLCIANALAQDAADPRQLPMTERKIPQPNRVKPNKTVLNWGMKK